MSATLKDIKRFKVKLTSTTEHDVTAISGSDAIALARLERKQQEKAGDVKVVTADIRQIAALPEPWQHAGSVDPGTMEWFTRKIGMFRLEVKRTSTSQKRHPMAPWSGVVSVNGMETYVTSASYPNAMLAAADLTDWLRAVSEGITLSLKESAT